MQRIVVGILLAVALVAGACGKPEGGATSLQTASGEKGAAPANKSGRVIAKFAGENFTEGEFRDEMSKLSRRARGALSDAERRRQFVDNYVMSRLIYKKGVEKSFERAPSVG